MDLASVVEILREKSRAIMAAPDNGTFDTEEEGLDREGFVFDLDGSEISDDLTGFPVVVVPREFMDGDTPALRADLMVAYPGEAPEYREDVIFQGADLLKTIMFGGKKVGVPVSGVLGDVTPTRDGQRYTTLILDNLTDTAEYLSLKRAYANVQRERRKARDYERLVQERENWHSADQEGRERVQARKAEEAAQSAEEANGFDPLDWGELFNEDHTEREFLPGKLLERGQQIAIVGDGKAGKSLVMLDWCYRAITGQPFLDDAEAREPITVLYLDAENNRSDIGMRLRSLGATPVELSRLVYLSFPPVNPLDTAEGAAQVLTLVERHSAEAVVIDTVSRFVQGKENDSDTWLSLYRNVHKGLKGSGVAGIRLDHFGKDAEKGSRGSSAKSQDIDHVWELTVRGEGPEPDGEVTVMRTRLRLNRTHTRTGLGPDVIDMVRVGRKTDREWLPGQTSHQVEVTNLDPFDVDKVDGDGEVMRRIREHLAERPKGDSQSKIEEAVGGRAARVRDALRLLESQGRLIKEAGPRNSSVYRLPMPLGDPS